MAKNADGGASGGSSAPKPAPAKPAIYIPPPIPTEKVTHEQMRASLELSLDDIRAGRVEDFEVVQARLRAKFFPSSKSR
jgi:hypothetical protein